MSQTLAATMGSSNFTDAGLSSHFEANTRFERQDEPNRFADTKALAENYWQAGVDWSAEMRALLGDLLQFVPWQEALARACADLLDGQWADAYLGTAASRAALWPSQLAGIAQAMWVVDNVGSVLIADATGSGKTRLGAHLTRAVQDRLWNTGRVRSGLTVLVCPPAVEQQWLREAVGCGLTLRTVSHGQLSRTAERGRAVYEDEVGNAQILAVDEAHNFLTPTSRRTSQIREAHADHVLLFTATPINRGAEDLLSLVDLLGADNFEDQALDLLDRLGRGGSHLVLTGAEQDLLRREIQRFTVRRTKSVLNAMVDQDPDAYRNAATGRVCRYPRHESKSYATGETTTDERVAADIRTSARSLRGVTLLGPNLSMPQYMRAEGQDERWLNMRLSAAAGLAAHHVLSSMRSSKAALLEHLAGTVAAVEALGITGLIKPQPTGDTIAKIDSLRQQGPPRIDLNCVVTDWLTDRDAWAKACQHELDLYNRILQAAAELTQTRERTKAAHLAALTKTHPRILAFDHHPISLAAIGVFIDAGGVEVINATGAATTKRRQVLEQFALDSQQPGIALCTDAMSEGVNLQGASAIVHLDMPTTMRFAEQRVGRVDRMDSPYEVIQAWWPADGAAFVTHGNELLLARSEESAALLGSNMSIPDLTGHIRNDAIDSIAITDAPIDVQRATQIFESTEAETWDGIRDALDPIRQLVSGPQALLTPAEYAQYRTGGHRVMARISPVHSEQPWAFFAARGPKHGAPRWILLAGPEPTVVHELDSISAELRIRLAGRPPSREFDQHCEQWLNHFLDAAANIEHTLTPRRLQRALHQMDTTCRLWAEFARRQGDHDTAERWEALARIANPGAGDVLIDPHQVGERWQQLTRPLREQPGRRPRKSRYSRITDIDPQLREQPFQLTDVEAHLAELEHLEPFDQRVTACILGVSPPR